MTTVYDLGVCTSQVVLINIFISGATLVFNETTYSASEAGPLEVDVCVQISDLTGELQSSLTVTLNDLLGIATGTTVICVS